MLKSINILGHKYEVKTEEHLGRDRSAHGMSCGNGCWIVIDPSIPPTMQDSTLVHEIVEQLDFLLELKLEHHQITALCSGLYQVLHDNKLAV